MEGPSVTPVERTVLAVAAPWSCFPASSLPVPPHFSYQAPTSAYQAPHSGVFGAGSFGVSMISITYFTRISLRAAPPAGARTDSTNPCPAIPTTRQIFFLKGRKHLVAGADHAELVALGIGEDHEGRVRTAAEVERPGAERL